MIKGRYALPDFLTDRCNKQEYGLWLKLKAKTHVRRDRARGNHSARVGAYKAAIHAAVMDGGHVDAYTGEALRWDLIRKYNNVDAKVGGRKYKKRFGDLPTVDHISDGKGDPKFRICSWRTNDAKSDLTYVEFVKLCQAVVAHRTTPK